MDLGLLIDFSYTITTKESEDNSVKYFLELMAKKYGIRGDIYNKFVQIRHMKLIERENKFRPFREIDSEILKDEFKIIMDNTDFEIYYDSHCKNLKLRPDFTKFLKFVRENGIKKVLVTDADFEYSMRVLNALGILEEFEYIVTAEDVMSSKPNFDIFIRAMLLAGCPRKLFFIGDSDRRDIMGAKKLGLITIKMNDDSNISRISDFNVRDFEGIIEILKNYLNKK